MPKETFYNLSEDKKQKIFKAAVQEFSIRCFSEASINQIVKTAGIPRGSFYQYFNDKEDLYLYMLQKVGEEKHQFNCQAYALDPEADVFTVCMQKTKASFKWGGLRPEYSRIGILMWLDHSEFMVNLRTASTGKLREMIERDQSRGLIKPEIESDLLVDILYTLILNEYIWDGLNEDIFLQKLDNIIKIVKEGVAVVNN